MKAIVQDVHGTTDVLRLEDIDAPTAGAGSSKKAAHPRT